MNKWDEMWLERMTENNISVITGVRYMDDIRAFLHAIRAGWRMWEGRLCYSEEWRILDLKDGKSSTRRTAEILLSIMNQIIPSLQFTMEIGEDFIDMKLPTLDVKIWIVNGRIEYDFFEKPMSSNMVLHAKTAQSDKNKFSSLTQEVVRRLLHTSRTLPSSHRMENLERFCQKMANSGHKMSYIRNVTIAGIEKYTVKYKKSILPSNHEEYKPLHLGTKYNTHGRWKKKMQEGRNWYKDKEIDQTIGKGKRMKVSQKAGKEKERIETSSVVFVPPTRGGKLVEMLKDKEDDLANITKFRIRYQEAGGTKLGLLFSTDLGAGLSCGRQDCQPCMSRDEKRPNCRAQSILYESKCTVCNPASRKSKSKEEPRKGIYYGESSRSLYERSREHMKDAKDFDSGSHIVKHWMNEHPDTEECPVFSFSILNRFKDCLSRQVAEAITINYTADHILNSKNEYMANCLTRICVEEERFDKQRRERDEELAEEAEKQKLLAFKQKHLRPKRTREDAKEPTDEPTGKRMKLFLEAGNPPDSEDLENGEGYRRLKELRAKMAEEKQRVLAWMENKNKEDEAMPKGWKDDLDSEDLPSSHDLHGKHVWKRVDEDSLVGTGEIEEDHAIPEGWKTSLPEEGTADDTIPTTGVTGGPSHHPGVGAPPQQINTRARGLTSQVQNQGKVPEGWKQAEDESINSQCIRNSSESEMWIVNLDSSNGSSKVPGNGDLGRQDENPSVNKTHERVATNSDVENVDVKDAMEAKGGPCHHFGGGAPPKQINTRARDLKSQDDKAIPEGWKVKREERKKKKDKDICLTSYTAWWTRVEKDERKFLREVRKTEERKEDEIQRKIQKIEETKKKKKIFIQKFFPTCVNSPGGSENLLPAESTKSAKVEGVRKSIKKVKSGSNLNYSAEIAVMNLKMKMKLFDDATSNSTRLSFIAVGQSELSIDSSPTNQKPGRSQGLEEEGI